jgi:hypothetical protein
MKKFGINGRGNQITKPTQPKQSFKFRIMFLGIAGWNFPHQIELTKNVVDCTLPKFSQSQLTVDVYNSKYTVMGKHSFAPINITLRNDIENRVAYVVETQVAKQVNLYNQETAPAAGMAKFQLKIEQLDGSNRAYGAGNEPVVLSTWHLTGCWLTDVDWGNLNYAESGTNNITLTVKFDNAFLTLLNFVGAKEDNQGWANSVHTNPSANIFSINTDSAV